MGGADTESGSMATTNTVMDATVRHWWHKWNIDDPQWPNLLRRRRKVNTQSARRVTRGTRFSLTSGSHWPTSQLAHRTIANRVDQLESWDLGQLDCNDSRDGNLKTTGAITGQPYQGYLGFHGVLTSLVLSLVSRSRLWYWDVFTDSPATSLTSWLCSGQRPSNRRLVVQRQTTVTVYLQS